MTWQRLTLVQKARGKLVFVNSEIIKVVYSVYSSCLYVFLCVTLSVCGIIYLIIITQARVILAASSLLIHLVNRGLQALSGTIKFQMTIVIMNSSFLPIFSLSFR